MAEEYTFKGGPDDFLIKPIKGGRWHRVIARYGRHFTGSKEAVTQDLDAMSKVLRTNKRIHTGANARRWDKGKDYIPTLCWSDFLAKYTKENDND